MADISERSRAGSFFDTVAAVSTPPGKGGIAVIRISGAGAFDAADKVFIPKDGKKLSEHPSRYMVYGDIRGDGVIIDDGMAVCFRSPASYTGEDTVEISCHGGMLITQLVLESVFREGVRPAGPGEFTRRAFVNGKLGLIKAESVIDLIDAESEDGVRLASSQSRGILSGRIDDLYSRMKRLVSSIYVYIDFPDEDLEDVQASELENELSSILTDIRELRATYRTGRAVREGITACIAGKPNVGKSSLLNAIVGSDRAIVTDTAGTTRDVVSEKIRLGRCAVILSDTAGIRDTADNVEKIGVGRAVREMENSELIIAVFDGSRPFDDQDDEFISRIENIISRYPEKRVIAAINKSDLERRLDTDIIRKRLPSADMIFTAASKGDTGDIAGIIDSRFTDMSLNLSADAVVSNARQYAALCRADEDIGRALDALKSGFTQDVAAMDIERAMADVAEIDGVAVSEDIVSDIFSRFCVGK